MSRTERELFYAALDAADDETVAESAIGEYREQETELDLAEALSSWDILGYCR